MYSKILVPVDLAHVERLETAMAVAFDLAGHYNATLVLMGATPSVPTSVAHTPKEFESKLQAHAADLAEKHGGTASVHVVISNDPSVGLEAGILHAIGETGADLVVMASHIPNVADHVWPSNGGSVASHAKSSVFIVRMG